MPAMQTCPQCAQPLPAGSRFCQDCGTDVTAPARRGTTRESGPKRKAGASFKGILLVGLVLVLVIGAAFTGLKWNRGSSGSGELTAAEIKAATHVKGTPMPGWLKSADLTIKREYMWAAENWEILQYMPCYCGCNMDPFNHRDNYACYFTHDGKGNITGFDDHGYG